MVESANKGSDGIAMPSGGTLSIAEAAKLLRAGEARLIAIIGPTDAGKTSLIAGLYDLFQNGSVAGFDFAGSLSLREFEHICHDARAASRRGTPHINRTTRGEVKFYHLHVGSGEAHDDLALVLGDRAGEEYRSAMDDVSVVAGFAEIVRADALTVLVDGERLLDIGARHNLRSEIIMILRALIEGGAITSLPRIAVVLTKLDLVRQSPEQERALADFANLVETIAQTYSGTFAEVASFTIAASPKNDILPRGAGIPDLLTFWLSKTPPRPTAPADRLPASRVFARLDALEKAEV